MWETVTNWARDRARNAYNLVDNAVAKNTYGRFPSTAPAYWLAHKVLGELKSGNNTSRMAQLPTAYSAQNPNQSRQEQAMFPDFAGNAASMANDLWQQQWNAQQQQYRAQTAALTAQELGRIAQARRMANADYESLSAENAAEAKAAESAYSLRKNDLARQAARAGRNLERRLGARGMAGSPRYMETGLVDIRDDQLAQQGQAAASRDDMLKRLELALSRQRRTRENILLGLNEEEARLSSDPQRLIYGVKF